MRGFIWVYFLFQKVIMIQNSTISHSVKKPFPDRQQFILKNQLLEVLINLYSANYFVTMRFSCVTLMSIFVKSILVCIKMKTILNFPIWNYFLLMIELFCYNFIFIFHDFSVPKYPFIYLII